MTAEINKFGVIEADIEDLYRKYTDLKKRLDKIELRVYALEHVALRLLVEVREGDKRGEIEHPKDTD